MREPLNRILREVAESMSLRQPCNLQYLIPNLTASLSRICANEPVGFSGVAFKPGVEYPIMTVV